MPAGAAGAVFVRTAVSGGALAVRPAAIRISVHGDLSLHGMRWDGWGGVEARGRGRARVKACVPDCNLGKWETPRVTVTLAGRVRCDGRLVYGWLGYRLHGEIPEGAKRRGSLDMRPRGC
ncbi:MAG TPA: hypothetical protein VGC32_17530 [Solirubrobacterales bacterium]